MHRSRGQERGAGSQRQEVKISVPDFDDPDSLGHKAEALAEQLAAHTGLTTHQLRRFYNEVKSIERTLDASSDRSAAWVNACRRIKLLKAKAVYNASRKQNKLPSEFKEFISICVDRIPAEQKQGEKTFSDFSQFFEAIVGYSSQYVREN